jgi:hypothetical protein
MVTAVSAAAIKPDFILWIRIRELPYENDRQSGAFSSSRYTRICGVEPADVGANDSGNGSGKKAVLVNSAHHANAP